MKFVIIGNGKMGMDCISIIMKHRSASIPLVLYSKKLDKHDQMKNYLKKRKINSISTFELNTSINIASIKASEPNFILNINSFWIIKREILQIPNIASINFHNGPLPLYGGVNIPSWTIINGEVSHGVTWHLIEDGIDTGDIVWQKKIDIDANTTAGMLMSKCIIEGIKLFENNFMTLLDNTYNSKRQKGLRTYYSLKDMPENSGIINLNNKFYKINNLIRGLNYIPFENNFLFSKLRSDVNEIIINKISEIETNESFNPGFIIEANSSCIRISCSNSIIQIENAMTHSFVYLKNDSIIKELNLKQGNFINNSYN